MATPHYLLFSESSPAAFKGPGGGTALGRWRIVLESVDGSFKLEASDEERDATAERLELLAVIRGLEALPQPAKVTLVTASRYVSRGLRFGLAEWRECDWQWERYGEMSAVTNADLWQRLDRALQFHQIHCRTWRFDAAHESEELRVGSKGSQRTGRARGKRAVPGQGDPSAPVRAGGIGQKTRAAWEQVRRWWSEPRAATRCAS